MCKAKHVVGFNAKGTLIASTLTQTAGADTATDTSDDRYSGTVEVNVTRTNHKAPKGDQTYTLTNGKVSFYDVNGVPVTTPVAGDTVRLHGKIGHAPKKCPGPSAVVTISRVVVPAGHSAGRSDDLAAQLRRRTLTRGRAFHGAPVVVQPKKTAAVS